MSILDKLDKIPPPYSTVFALVLVSLLGLFVILWQEESRLLGVGIVVGGFLSILFKASMEAAGGERGQWVRKLFGGKGDEDSES